MTFDRYALECAVSENPGCGTAACALRDYLEENGYSHLGARREVAKLVRLATERKQADRYREAFRDDPKYRIRIIRHLAKARRCIELNIVNVDIIPGGCPPCWVVADGTFQTADGTTWENVSPDSMMGQSDGFVPSRYLVRIGAVWLAANLPIRDNSSPGQ
jgi:hypothetical protein